MKKNKALTLVEMLAAIAIVGLLSAAALRVTGNLARTGRNVQTRADDNALTAGLENLLAGDVTGALKYRKASEGLELKTMCILDDKDLEIRHLPATVSYRVQKVGDDNWLIRTQYIEGRRKTARLVCKGVSKVSLVATVGSAGRSGKWKSMPPQLEIALETSGNTANTANTERFRFQLR